MFGGKTLVVPDTFHAYMEQCLRDDSILEEPERKGISEIIHTRLKDRMIETYLLLFKTLEEVIKK